MKPHWQTMNLRELGRLGMCASWRYKFKNRFGTKTVPFSTVLAAVACLPLQDEREVAYYWLLRALTPYEQARLEVYCRNALYHKNLRRDFYTPQAIATLTYDLLSKEKKQRIASALSHLTRRACMEALQLSGALNPSNPEAPKSI